MPFFVTAKIFISVSFLSWQWCSGYSVSVSSQKTSKKLTLFVDELLSGALDKLYSMYSDVSFWQSLNWYFWSLNNILWILAGARLMAFFKNISSCLWSLSTSILGCPYNQSWYFEKALHIERHSFSICEYLLSVSVKGRLVGVDHYHFFVVVLPQVPSHWHQLGVPLVSLNQNIAEQG